MTLVLFVFLSLSIINDKSHRLLMMSKRNKIFVSPFNACFSDLCVFNFEQFFLNFSAILVFSVYITVLTLINNCSCYGC